MNSFHQQAHKPVRTRISIVNKDQWLKEEIIRTHVTDPLGLNLWSATMKMCSAVIWHNLG